MDVFKEQFSAGEVAEAAGIEQAQFQNWLRRSCFVMDLSAPIAGRRLFTAAFTIEIALMKELARFGMGPNQSSEIVRTWGFRPVEVRRPSWISNPTGKETLVLFVSVQPEAERDEDKNGNHGSRLFPDGFFRSIRGDGSDTYYNESAATLEDEGGAYMVVPVGSVAQRMLQRLQTVLDVRQGGSTNAI